MKKLCVLMFGFALALPLHAQTEGSSDAAPAAADTTSTGDAAPATTDTSSSTPPADAAAAPADAAASPDAAAPADASTSPDTAAPAEAAAAAPTDSSATGEATPADAAAATGEASPATDATAGSTEPPPAEAAPTETAAAESPAPSEEKPANPHHLYLGGEYNRVTVQISDPALASAFGGQDFAGKFYTLRAGIRLFDAIGFELQGGAKGENGGDPGRIQMTNYYGVFVVPTGNVFNLFEIAASIGYNSFTLQRGNASRKFSRPAFGVNVEMPLREISDSLPDLRFTTGYKVFFNEHEARVYGFHAGLRFDFQL